MLASDISKYRHAPACTFRRLSAAMVRYPSLSRSSHIFPVRNADLRRRLLHSPSELPGELAFRPVPAHIIRRLSESRSETLIPDHRLSVLYAIMYLYIITNRTELSRNFCIFHRSCFVLKNTCSIWIYQFSIGTHRPFFTISTSRSIFGSRFSSNSKMGKLHPDRYLE